MKRINLTKRAAATLGLGMMMAMAPLAMAQQAPGAKAGTKTNDLGSVDTSKQTTITTTTTKTDSGVGSYQVAGGDTAPLPNTGGEPLLFVLAGSMLIGGGWVLRRKRMHSNG
ncbi:MAG: LPXTG cell wall anchor domain-containing protein [Abditibacteriaceae bacterium]